MTAAEHNYEKISLGRKTKPEFTKTYTSYKSPVSYIHNCDHNAYAVP